MRLLLLRGFVQLRTKSVSLRLRRLLVGITVRDEVSRFLSRHRELHHRTLTEAVHHGVRMDHRARPEVQHLGTFHAARFSGLDLDLFPRSIEPSSVSVAVRCRVDELGSPVLDASLTFARDRIPLLHPAQVVLRERLPRRPFGLAEC